MYKVCIDTRGTFTDCVVIDDGCKREWYTIHSCRSTSCLYARTLIYAGQYGRCVSQATAVGRELFSGMFEEFPNLKLSHSMLGGGVFAFSNMLAPKITGKDAVLRFRTGGGKISQYLENDIYFDTSGSLQWGKDQMECAAKVLGADHILYGSPYPIRRDWFTQGVGFIKNPDIDEESKELILSENAIRLFNIK